MLVLSAKLDKKWQNLIFAILHYISWKIYIAIFIPNQSLIQRNGCVTNYEKVPDTMCAECLSDAMMEVSGN